MALFHLKRSCSLAEFFNYVNSYPLAINLLIIYCKHRNWKLLEDYYYQDDQRIGSALWNVKKSLGMNVDEKIHVLKGAFNLISKSAKTTILTRVK